MARTPRAGGGVAVNVNLRAVRAGDRAWLDEWLPSAAAAIGYGLGEQHDALQRIIERDGEREGLIAYREHAPVRSAAIIELIATPTALARRGSGMAAAASLETTLRQRGVSTIYAPAPAVHGIAMYFWIRLGYRPLLRDEWPCKRDGVAWLVRRLDS